MQICAPLNSSPVPALQWIEVASAFQIPSFHIVGLPSPEVAEARERIRAAVSASGFEFPRRRVVLNLSPASIRKRGTGLDLAMALAVMSSSSKSGHASGGALSAWGELGLDGRVKTTGQITRALFSAWAVGVPALIVPQEDETVVREAFELIRASGTLRREPPAVFAVKDLREAWAVVSGGRDGPAPLEIHQREETPAPLEQKSFSLLPLPPLLERAIAVAALGFHHLLLLGPRGTGKSFALEWLIALQPPIRPDERLRNTLIAELTSGLASSPSHVVPIRRVSVQVRPAALTGGVSAHALAPGEFSLAHGGVLIADEFPEWSRDAREALREPLENGRVLLTRARESAELPARFNLAATGNLCPCGGWPKRFPLPEGNGKIKPLRCRCTEATCKQYLMRLSGPILDRVDMVLTTVGGPLPAHSGEQASQEILSSLKDRVALAQKRTEERWGGRPGQLSARTVETLWGQHPAWHRWVDWSKVQSFRSRHKTIRVALSLAAWDGLEEPTRAHFAEALCYRSERLGFLR